MPTAWGDLSVGVANGIVYAIGGFDTLSHPVATVEAYDPSTDQWSTVAPLPTARARRAVAVVNGIVYAIGGFAAQSYDVCCGAAGAASVATSTVQRHCPSASFRHTE